MSSSISRSIAMTFRNTELSTMLPVEFTIPLFFDVGDAPSGAELDQTADVLKAYQD